MSRLRLWPGYNNGLIGQILKDENDLVFDLTGASSIALELYNSAGEVVKTITGTIDSASDGEYSVIPGASSLSGLTIGAEYFYRLKVVSSTYPQGRLFDTDPLTGRLYRCVIGVD